MHGQFHITLPNASPIPVLPCPLYSWSIAGLDTEYTTRREASEVVWVMGADSLEVRLESQRCAADSTSYASAVGEGLPE